MHLKNQAITHTSLFGSLKNPHLSTSLLTLLKMVKNVRFNYHCGGVKNRIFWVHIFTRMFMGCWWGDAQQGVREKWLLSDLLLSLVWPPRTFIFKNIEAILTAIATSLQLLKSGHLERMGSSEKSFKMMIVSWHKLHNVFAVGLLLRLRAATVVF